MGIDCEYIQNNIPELPKVLAIAVKEKREDPIGHIAELLFQEAKLRKQNERETVQENVSLNQKRKITKNESDVSVTSSIASSTVTVKASRELTNTVIENSIQELQELPASEYAESTQIDVPIINLEAPTEAGSVGDD